MSYKVTCPGCDTSTSDNTRNFVEEGKCGKCGLSLAVLEEVQRVRASHATEEVKARFEELAGRAGKAEAEVLKLTRRLERAREVLDGGDDWV